MHRLPRRTLPLLASALLLVGCGGDEPTGGAHAGDERTTSAPATGERTLEATARAAVALMTSEEAGTVDAVLPTLQDVEALLQGALGQLPADQREGEAQRRKEQGGAPGTREKIRATVTRRARAARESAAKDLDWSQAEFDRVDEPASRKPLAAGLPEEVASVTFYVKAGGASYRFRAKEALRCAGGWNFGEGWRYDGPDTPHDARIETWEADVRTFQEGQRKAQARASELARELHTARGDSAPTAESVMAALREIVASAPRPARVDALLAESGAALDAKRLNREDRDRVERLQSDARSVKTESGAIGSMLDILSRSAAHEALYRSLEQPVRADLASPDEATRLGAEQIAYWLRIDTSSAAAR